MLRVIRSVTRSILASSGTQSPATTIAAIAALNNTRGAAPGAAPAEVDAPPICAGTDSGMSLLPERSDPEQQKHHQAEENPTSR